MASSCSEMDFECRIDGEIGEGVYGKVRAEVYLKIENSYLLLTFEGVQSISYQPWYDCSC